MLDRTEARDRLRHACHASRHESVTLEIDGERGHRAGGHVGDARRGRRRHQVPKLCATDSLEPFGSCRLCLVEIEGRKGYPGLVHDAGRGRHEGAHAKRRSCRSCARA